MSEKETDYYFLKSARPEHLRTSNSILKTPQKKKNISLFSNKNDLFINSPPMKFSKLKISLDFNSNLTTMPKTAVQKGKSLSKITKTNFHPSNTEEVQEETKKCINEIKKLNFWDVQNILTKEMKEIPSIIECKAKERDAINWVNDLKVDLSKLKLDKVNPHIKNFQNRADMEYKCMLLHNINISKKKFNFEVFEKIKQKSRLTGSSLLEKSNSSKYSNKMSMADFDINNLQNQTENHKFNHLKFDENYEKLSSIDYYRYIVRSKMKTEKGYRKEIMDLCQSFYGKKIEKQLMEKARVEILNDLNYLKLEVASKEITVECEKKELQKRFERLLNRNPIEEIFNAHPPLESTGVNQNTINSNPNQSLSVNNTIKRRKSIPKIATNSEQFFKMNTDIQKIVNKMEDELETLNNNYKIIKLESSKKLDKLTRKIDLLEKEIKILKNNISNLIKDQRNYFLEILKKGIDVRLDGVTWVIIKLIELKTDFLPTMFPRIFDSQQIEYLLNYSYKRIQSNQLKIILKTLKNREKKFRGENSDVIMSSSKTNFNKTGFDFMMYNVNPTNSSASNNVCFSNKIVNIFENIFKKYENITKSNYEQRIEEVNLNRVVDELKNKMKYSHTDLNSNSNEGFINLNPDDYEDDPFYTSNGFFKYISENKRHKEYFDEILNLRETILKIDEELDNLRSEEIVNYKKKFDVHKTEKNNLQYEITYSALFGNGIIV